MLKKCYHISRIANRESISKNGLVPKSCKIMDYKNKIFFSTNPEILGFDYVDYENVDIWSFYLPEKDIKKDENAWNDCFGFCENKTISPNKLVLEQSVV
jgi:hypothetical protein